MVKLMRVFCSGVKHLSGNTHTGIVLPEREFLLTNVKRGVTVTALNLETLNP